jgi:uncharacterized protein YecE (DUF72 family)
MPLHVGTCSWNYDSWVGLVYSRERDRAVNYLPEYSAKYRSVEIDSWFYKLPVKREVEEYAAAVDEGFTFVCKAPQDITLTHKRTKAAEPNPAFLSTELFGHFLEAIEPLKDKIGAIVLEFEYLNRQKMPGAEAFIQQLEGFVRSVPREIPLALEPRNGSWLNSAWFDFLQRNELAHVFSEKIYMPRMVDLFEDFGDRIGNRTVIRLLGGDRAAIEKATEGKWDRIVSPQADLPEIAAIAARMSSEGREVFIDVNNHYEGSAPLTIERFLGVLP